MRNELFNEKRIHLDDRDMASSQGFNNGGNGRAVHGRRGIWSRAFSSVDDERIMARKHSRKSDKKFSSGKKALGGNEQAGRHR